MTNAERQKRYRDKKRGGLARERRPGGMTDAELAKTLHVSVSMLRMARWIIAHAPDVVPAIEAGELTVTAEYRRLNDELDRAFFLAIHAGRPAGDVRLMGRRRDGKFEMFWMANDEADAALRRLRGRAKVQTGGQDDGDKVEGGGVLPDVE
jgi:hypothetical protein